jgi:diguanylate cyclase (GGDEF)-like protein
MDIARVRSFMIRHRASFKDVSILIAVFLSGLYWTYEYDIFKNHDGVSAHEHTIELDEALLLGGIMTLGLLIFSIRRYVEQRRETVRRLAAEQHVRTLAFQDALTGLANRRQFDDALKAAAAAPPREGAVHALILLDLNAFKQINDVYGHGVGDQVLTIVAQRLLGAMRDGDLAARLGGDEFAILALHLVGREAATNIALRVIEVLTQPVTAGSARHQIGVGLGISLIPGDAATPEQALRKADLALYRAKEERRSAVRFLEDDMDKRVQERHGLVQELRAAVANESIRAYFQPSVQLNTKRIIGFDLPNPSAAPNPLTNTLSLFRSNMQDKIMKSAEAMPEFKYSCRLTPDVRSFAEILNHISDISYFLCSNAKVKHLHRQLPRGAQRPKL